MFEKQVIKIPVCKGSLESGLRNVVIILRSLHPVIQGLVTAATF